MGGRSQRTLVVWCPDWPTTAAGRHRSEPVAVVAANRVLACSAAARGAGVQRGLRRRQAESRCPGLVVIEHEPSRDARAFEPVVAAVERFTPGVEIVRPGLCAIATRGPSRYFGGDQALAARVTEAVEEVLAGAGACRVGIADGSFAAERAARLGVIVPPGHRATAAFLAPFPIASLNRPELADVLVRLGIPTLGALAELPADAVLARFGAEGMAAHRVARGLVERPLATRVPPPDLTVTLELDPPADRLDTIAFAARAMAARLHDELGVRGLACTRVRIEAETEHGEHLSRLWRHDGALTPAALAERMRWQLDGWRDITAGLTLLRLAPDEVRRDTGRQLGFWGGDQALDERAARALVRVQGMLGPEAVATAVVGGGRGPAEQVRLVPWGDEVPSGPVVPSGPPGPVAPAGPSHLAPLGGPLPGAPPGVPPRTPRGERTAPPWPGRLPAPAPATVHSVPSPAEVVDGTGRLVAVSGRGSAGSPPARLSVAGGPWVEVVAWAGPWPLDERWWDPPARCRQARWQVLTADGVARLLAVEGGRWWVRATYD